MDCFIFGLLFDITLHGEFFKELLIDLFHLFVFFLSLHQLLFESLDDAHKPFYFE